MMTKTAFSPLLANSTAFSQRHLVLPVENEDRKATIGRKVACIRDCWEGVLAL